jgi:hypothetical protein
MVVAVDHIVGELTVVDGESQSLLELAC